MSPHLRNEMWGTRFYWLLESDGALERGFGARGAGDDLVGAAEELEGILLLVEDGEDLRVEGDGDGLGLAWGEGDPLEACETFEGLACLLRERGVDLGDLGSGALAGVLHGEGDAVGGTIGFEIGVGVGGVGEAVAEGEERLLVLGFVPLVADLGALVVGDGVA